MKKVLLFFSGGNDSTLSACKLASAGYDVYLIGNIGIPVLDTSSSKFSWTTLLSGVKWVSSTIKSAILEYNPDSVNYQKRKREALANYAIGEAPLSNFVNEDQIFGSYYNRFSS